MTKADKIKALVRAAGGARSAKGKQLKAKLNKASAATVTRAYDKYVRQGTQQVFQQAVMQQVVVQPRRRSTTRRRSTSCRHKQEAATAGEDCRTAPRHCEEEEDHWILDPQEGSTDPKDQGWSHKAAPKKKKSAAKRPRVAKPSKAASARASAIARAISSGRIAPKNQNIRKASDYASGTRKQKVDRFVKQYVGVQGKGPQGIYGSQVGVVGLPGNLRCKAAVFLEPAATRWIPTRSVAVVEAQERFGRSLESRDFLSPSSLRLTRRRSLHS